MIRPLAIYLPQFHPIPENDTAWGEGFTEWTNVKNAVPLFDGHYQPHVPHDSIGYYDLRDPEVLVKQAAMAREHSIYGFAFYHYWFNGKRLLNEPIDNMLELGRPDFPFCFIWANENWTKRWDGKDKEIIIKQDYSLEDDRQHIKFLCEKVFNDKRYITIDGKPLLIIYKPELFPDIKKTVQIWREEAKEYGIGELYLCYFENGIFNINPDQISFDASIEFQPQWRSLSSLKFNRKGNYIKRALHKLGFTNYLFQSNAVYNYKNVVQKMSNSTNTQHKIYPCITPMWDNSARKRKNAVIFNQSTPEIYGKWLRTILKKFKPFSSDENFIFINAWNEWAEGNHLEPCQKWGMKYLEATKSVILNIKEPK